MTVKLLIADNHELVRAGLRELLRESGIEIVGEASSSSELMDEVVAKSPHVVLLSPLLLGEDVATELAHIESRVKASIVLFCTHRTPALIAAGVACSLAGIVSTDASRDSLIASILGVAEGKGLWSREELRRAGSSTDFADDIDVQLTRRERQVLVKLVDGLTNKQIAQELDISYETVKEHVQHILRKIAVTDRTQAAVWAVRHGLV